MLAETARRYALRAPRLDAPFLLALLLWAYILYNLTDSGMAIELLERSAVGLPAHRFLMKSLLKAAVFVGCIAGQVGLGVLADQCGARRAFVCAALFAIAGALWAALAARHFTRSKSAFYWHVIFARAVMGVGVGGAFPLSTFATRASAQPALVAEEKLSWAFSGQALGFCGPFLVVLAMYPRLTESLIAVWAVVLAFPALVQVGLLASVLNGLPFLDHASWDDAHDAGGGGADGAARANGAAAANGKPAAGAADAKAAALAEAAAPPAARSDGGGDADAPLWRELVTASAARYWLGVGGSWFLVDVTSFGLKIFGPEIVGEIFGADEPISAMCWQNIALNLISLPAFLLAIPLVRERGARWVQLRSLALNCACFALAALLMPLVGAGVQFGFVCVLYFTVSSGIGLTNYCLASQVQRLVGGDARRAQSTFIGIAAACSKLGAIAGMFLFEGLLDAYGIASACFLCCGMMAGGFALTSLFVDEEPTGEATARLLAHDIRSP